MASDVAVCLRFVSLRSHAVRALGSLLILAICAVPALAAGPAEIEVASNQSLTFRFNVYNQGRGTASASVVRAYLTGSGNPESPLPLETALEIDPPGSCDRCGDVPALLAGQATPTAQEPMYMATIPPSGEGSEGTVRYLWVVVGGDGGGNPDVAGQLLAALKANDRQLAAVITTASPEESVAPTVTLHPVNVTLAGSGTASFTAEATGIPSPTLQWQLSIYGGPWNDIGGADASPLQVAVGPAEDERRYRAVFSNAAGTVISDPAYFLSRNLVNASLPFNDTFTSTGDGFLSSLWTQRRNMIRVTGTATLRDTAFDGLATLNGVNTATFIVQVDASNLLSAGAAAGLVGRYDAGTNSLYYGRFSAAGGGLAEIHKVVGGVDTLLASAATASTNAGTLKLTMIGTVLVLSLNNVGLASFDDNVSPLGPGTVGMMGSAGIVLDNFSAQ